MTTDVSICNMAIFLSGSTKKIESLDELSQEAQLCKQVFEPSRDYILTLSNWRFARKTLTLALLNTDIPDWAYQYQYPNDCLRSIRLVGAMPDDIIPYEVGYIDGPKKVINTDQDEAKLVYTRQVTEVGLFSQAFATSLSWYIGHLLASGLGANKHRLEWTMHGFEKVLDTARVIDGSESDAPPEEQPSTIEEARE